jgi:hypothetical protein
VFCFIKYIKISHNHRLLCLSLQSFFGPKPFNQG